MAAIDVQHLQKSFKAKAKSVEAVKNVTFAVEPGERIACIGPNGAGKSTTIKMLTGILTPTSGTARVLGLVPWKQRRQLTSRLGVLFGQRSQLSAELSTVEGLRLLGAIFGLDKRSTQRRTHELAELLDARDLFDQPVRSLSLGQRMRCELAASMLHSPEILFLDEPTIGLDLLAKQRFRELLVSLNETSGTTVFLTSHDIPDIEAVADRVIVINHGTIICDETVDRLRTSLLSTKLVDVRFERSPGELILDGMTVLARTETSAELRIDTRVQSVRAVLDTLMNTGLVADMSITDPPLEDVIAQIYGAPS